MFCCGRTKAVAARALSRAAAAGQRVRLAATGASAFVLPLSSLPSLLPSLSPSPARAATAQPRCAGTQGGGALRSSRVLLARNVVENTLADTPSGYIQDPRAHPRAMARYDRISSASQAALEAMEEKEELLRRAELAYDGFTTLAIQSSKRAIMLPRKMHESAAQEQARLQQAIVTLERELVSVQRLVGTHATRPLSEERLALLAWQQRQAKREDADSAFRTPPAPAPTYSVRVAADGSEEIQLHQPTHGHDADAAAAGSDEEAPASTLPAPETVLVTVEDVNHVRYVLALGYRRVRRFDDAEATCLAILRDNVRSVEAVESLLELYVGLERWDDVQKLFRFLTTEFDAALREGRVPSSAADQRQPAARDGESAPAGTGARADGAAPAAAADAPPPPLAPSAPSESVDASTEAQRLLVPPADIAMSLLADMIVESAARFCVENGEGATGRHFMSCLAPLTNALEQSHASLLIEAVFRSLDDQHFLARIEMRDRPVAPGSQTAVEASQQLIYSLVISFLKLLLVTRVADKVNEPIAFRFFVLSKLHSALRSSGRRRESYPFFEEMAKLYRANSSVYKRRQARQRAAKDAAHADAYDEPLAPGPLDAVDDVYRASVFEHLNDRALDSPADGRRLCVEAMDEFPEAAAPWETLALVLHREDPVGNLGDAITAARRGLQLEPFNLALILTCANFYKADHRYALYDLIMDRYRLLCFMLENAASDADLRAVAAEILEAEKRIAKDVEGADEEQLYEKEKLQESPALLRSVEEWRQMQHREKLSPASSYDGRSQYAAPVKSPVMYWDIKQDNVQTSSMEGRPNMAHLSHTPVDSSTPRCHPSGS